MKKMVIRSALISVVSILLVACSGPVPDKGKVKEALKSVLSGSYEITSVTRNSDVNGLIEVVIKYNDQPLVVYLDKNLKYVITGSIIEIKGKKNLTLETQKKYMASQPASQLAPAKK